MLPISIIFKYYRRDFSMYKKIMLSLMLPFFLTNQSYCSSDDMNKKAAECINYIIAKILENGSYIGTTIAESTKEYRESLGKQIADHSKEVATGIVFVCSTAVINTGSIIYKYLLPSAEDIASTEEAVVRAQEARERTAYLAVKTKFRECLIDPIKSKSEKNIDGVPTACEKEVSAFVICGGYHEAIQMTSDFGRTK